MNTTSHQVHNVRVLNDLYVKLADSFPNEDVDQLNQRISLAAVRVLGDIKPYVLGQKQIESNQLKQIEKEETGLRETISKKIAVQEGKLASKAHRLMVTISKLREERKLSNREDIKKMMNDYYQIMGCTLSYGEWEKGTRILGPHSSRSDYLVDEVITNKQGLQIVILVPIKRKDKYAAPIICCRGTIETNHHNLIDDMNKHIGQYSFEASKDRILEALQRVSNKYGPVVISGHSLGGAVAQITTAYFCDRINGKGKPLIKAVYHYNAPGVGENIAKEYKRRLTHISEQDKPEVISYRHVSDIVSLSGGAHIEPTKKYDIKDNENDRFNISNLRAPMAALRRIHSLKPFTSEAVKVELKGRVSWVRTGLHKLTEVIRRVIAFVFKRILINKVNTQEQQKAMALKLHHFVKINSSNPIFSNVTAQAEKT